VAEFKRTKDARNKSLKSLLICANNTYFFTRGEINVIATPVKKAGEDSLPRMEDISVYLNVGMTLLQDQTNLQQEA
jgi:hypothetical protein